MAKLRTISEIPSGQLAKLFRTQLDSAIRMEDANIRKVLVAKVKSGLGLLDPVRRRQVTDMLKQVHRDALAAQE